jgi:phage terminase large subunit|tara:strand:+ start:1553 stop:1822 length:270 start_codon:yes stop_codon:yes gene_type:complete
MTKKATVKKKLASVKTQVKEAKLNSNLKFGKFHPDAKLKATGKKVTSEDNNARVKSVNGKTIKEALASGLYTATDLNYDINKIKTLEIV